MVRETFVVLKRAAYGSASMWFGKTAKNHVTAEHQGRGIQLVDRDEVPKEQMRAKRIMEGLEKKENKMLRSLPHPSSWSLPPAKSLSSSSAGAFPVHVKSAWNLR